VRAVVQRVSEAKVEVGRDVLARIGKGVVVLLAVAEDDEEKDADFMANKLSHLRLFSDEEGRLNLSMRDVGGEILLISNFTVLGNTKKGHRPSYAKAATAEKAEKFYNMVLESLKGKGLPAFGGKFGAKMQVSLVNDGPVTLIVDSKGGDR
jgi:D-tyrosyl-tRNA(Tyr) deacylase